MNHYNKLSKEDKKRHFSHELGAGKGDLRFRGRRGREEVNKELDNYRNNPFWDNCEFERKKKKEKWR